MRAAALRASYIEGAMAPEELDWLALTAAGRRVIVEIGSGRGRSTTALALSTPGVVFAIDSWDEEDDPAFTRFQANLYAEIQTGKVVPLRADSYDASLRLPGLLPLGQADMVFIDGSHEYRDVRRDLVLYRALLSPRGMLCGHDYDGFWPGVMRAVDEIVPARRRGPGSLWYYLPR